MTPSYFGCTHNGNSVLSVPQGEVGSWAAIGSGICLANVRLACYTGHMNATLTIRLGESQRQRLRELASQLGKSDSELVREMIERGLAEESIGRRLAYLRGKLSDSPSAADVFSREIRERNWRS